MPNLNVLHIHYVWIRCFISLRCFSFNKNLYEYVLQLTRWGRMTHMCVSDLTMINSDSGLSPGRCQAIIWTNAGISFIEPKGINFGETLIKIHIFAFRKGHLKKNRLRNSIYFRLQCFKLHVYVGIDAEPPVHTNLSDSVPWITICVCYRVKMEIYSSIISFSVGV